MIGQEEELEEDVQEVNDVEEWIDETSVISGEMLDYYFDRFMRKFKHFRDFKYLKPHHLRDLYNIYYSKKYRYEDGNPVWEELLSKFDKTLFKFLTNHDQNYCEKLVPIFYKYLNNILKEVEEEKEKREKQKQEKEEKKKQKQQQKQQQKKQKQEEEEQEQEPEEQEEPGEGDSNDSSSSQSSSKPSSNDSDSKHDEEPEEDKEESEEESEPEEEEDKSEEEEESDDDGDSDEEEEEEQEEDDDSEEDEEEDEEEDDEPEEEEESILESMDDYIEANISQALSEAKDSVEKFQEEERHAQQIKVTGAGKGPTGDGRPEADPKIVMDLLNAVDLRSNAIDEFIKKTIKSFREHFSNISKVEIEPILDAEEIEEIDGLELLPFVKQFPFLWDEIYNVKKLYSCVVDCYVDNSGSMTSSANINVNYNSFTRQGGTPNWVSMINLAKVLLYKLYSMKYIADIYRFEHDVEKLDINKGLRLTGHGGTHIDNVIRMVKQTARPSLIITDGEDRITQYSDLAYIINVSPGSFERMITQSNEAVQKMVQNNQILAFVDNKFLTPRQYNFYKQK